MRSPRDPLEVRAVEAAKLCGPAVVTTALKSLAGGRSAATVAAGLTVLGYPVSSEVVALWPSCVRLAPV